MCYDFLQILGNCDGGAKVEFGDSVGSVVGVRITSAEEDVDSTQVGVFDDRSAC
jgi:hypothetical protein